MHHGKHFDMTDYHLYSLLFVFKIVKLFGKKVFSGDKGLY